MPSRFTNKAAGEMRARVLKALDSVNDKQPLNDPDAQTWTLAKAALKQAEKNNWGLLEHPARIRIQTIDSLCSALTRQMPLLSRFGSQPAIAQDLFAHPP
jgi:ATP-dependent exoDNAse (exonuclease V) beta subunit